MAAPRQIFFSPLDYPAGVTVYEVISITAETLRAWHAEICGKAAEIKVEEGEAFDEAVAAAGAIARAMNQLDQVKQNLEAHCQEIDKYLDMRGVK